MIDDTQWSTFEDIDNEYRETIEREIELDLLDFCYRNNVEQSVEED